MQIIPWLTVTAYSALNCWASRSKNHHSQTMNFVSAWTTSSFYLVSIVYILAITKGATTPYVILGYGLANAIGSSIGMAISLKYLKKFERD